MKLTHAEQAQIEQLLEAAINDYPVPEEHYAYVSTLMTHVQADFSQALDYWSTEPRPEDFQSSYLNIVIEALRREDPFEQTLEERALAILRALPSLAPPEQDWSQCRTRWDEESA